MRPDPIIVTLQLDEMSAGFFERARQTHFPPSLNKVPAHLTLFHALPGDDPEAIVRAFAPAVQRAPFSIAVEGVMPLGRGVAYRLASPELAALRAALAAPFAGQLTGQDRAGFRPHITVQNKVTKAAARETLMQLSEAFSPFDAVAEGLQLWFYRGGPWAPFAAMPFARST
ncbi:MAG: 2'-5' RNA ligase family protein [Pseudomonadota bacterium]